MSMKCPDCGAQNFYVKDPDDQFSISEFSLERGTVEYIEDPDSEGHVPVLDESEIHCDRCAWHDTFESLKK